MALTAESILFSKLQYYIASEKRSSRHLLSTFAIRFKTTKTHLRHNSDKIHIHSKVTKYDYNASKAVHESYNPISLISVVNSLNLNSKNNNKVIHKTTITTLRAVKLMCFENLFTQ